MNPLVTLTIHDRAEIERLRDACELLLRPGHGTASLTITAPASGTSTLSVGYPRPDTSPGRN